MGVRKQVAVPTTTVTGAAGHDLLFDDETGSVEKVRVTVAGWSGIVSTYDLRLAVDAMVQRAPSYPLPNSLPWGNGHKAR